MANKYEAAEYYDNRYAKTDFIRNELASLRIKMKAMEDIASDTSLGLSEKEVAKIKQMQKVYLDVRNRILDDPNLCEQPHGFMYDTPEGLVPQGFVYEDEKFETIATDMFAEIANTAKEKDVREIASDIKALEDSVTDAKIAYEIDDNSVTQAAVDTLTAIDAAERVLDYDASDVHYDKMIASPNKEQIEQAKAILDDITGADASKSVALEMREAALREIGKHPFNYAVYSARQNFKSIMEDVSAGRKLVKATEGTFLDSISATAKSAAYAIKNGASQATTMALQAGRNTCVTAATNLNAAYEKGSEMLIKAKEALNKVAVNVMQKADRVMEVITVGGYSKMLEAASRKAFVSMEAENQTVGDKIAQALVKAHAKTHGYTLDEACDYISSIKKDLWANKQSPVDFIAKSVNEGKYGAAMLQKEVKDDLSTTKAYIQNKAGEVKDTVLDKVQTTKDNVSALKASVIEKVAHAKENVLEKVDVAKDKAANAAKVATLTVKKEALELQVQSCLNTIRLYEKLHKVNEYRIDKALEKANVKNDMLFEASAARDKLENNRPESFKAKDFEVPDDLRNAIDALQTLENKGTAELFAQSILEKKLAKAERDFDNSEMERFVANTHEFIQWDADMESANAEVAKLKKDCDRANDKLIDLADRSSSINKKLDTLYDLMNEKVNAFAKANLELDTFKKEKASVETPIQEDELDVEEPELV